MAKFTGLQDVMEHINRSEDPAAEMTACMRFMLAIVNLDVSEMSDAVQEAFLDHEAALESSGVWAAGPM